MSDATRRLDGVTSLAALDALVPSDYADALATEPATADSRAEIEALDGRLGAAFRQLDDFAARAMKLRIDAALATDTSIGAPTRKVFATTIAGYAGKLDLLADRVRSIAERGGAADPAAVTARVVEAARTTLAQRDAMAEPVLALVAERAGALVALADGRARDKRTDVALRKQWSAVRRELEAVQARPARVRSPYAQRLAEHPEQIDEPIEPEINVADLIELDDGAPGEARRPDEGAVRRGLCRSDRSRTAHRARRSPARARRSARRIYRAPARCWPTIRPTGSARLRGSSTSRIRRGHEDSSTT